MKKLSVKDPLFFQRLITKQLEKYNVDYQFVVDNPKIEGKDWFRFYTFDNPKEYEDWKQFCIEELMNSKEKLTLQQAENEFAYLDLKHGLSQKYIFENGDIQNERA